MQYNHPSDHFPGPIYSPRVTAAYDFDERGEDITNIEYHDYQELKPANSSMSMNNHTAPGKFENNVFSSKACVLMII